MERALGIFVFFGVLALIGLVIAILVILLTRDNTEATGGGVVMLNSNIYDIASTNIIGVGYIANEDDEANAAFILPSNFTLSNLFVNLAFSPGTGNSRVFTVRVNGADTALSVAITGDETSVSNTTTTVSALAGDSVSVRVVDSGTPNDSTVEISFQYR